MNEEPIQQQFRDQMRAIGEVLDQVFNNGVRGTNRKIGWALLVFPFDCPPGARTNYISNSERSDMINSMKEFIARAEGRIQAGENVI